MSAAGATERRASLYDEIADDDGRREPEATGKSAFWGAPRAPMTVAISADGGESWPWLRNLDEGDGYCMTNNSEQKLNREFSYPSIKQGADGNLHIAYTPVSPGDQVCSCLATVGKRRKRMIIGNLQALQQAGLPPALKQLLSSEACSLAALSARENGRFQPDDAPWFCTLSVVQTQPAAERHTEYHRQWADIQVIPAGEERIQAGMAPAMRPEDHELKPDLYICQPAPESVSILLRPGDFAVFYPGEPHRGAVCGFDASTGQKGSIQNPR